eukprot:TRINITY_DN8685_c0_g1_i1.p1 TRINITY_DN8685_c0_g1~~TRINITY_DN8685_c0_g1_i1.p1  ORF type:complete len:475 (-),score=93.90 TRINITY_DN8685_c0_g1_i1:40-1464(-)
MLLPVSPEDDYEGFWLGQIHAIPNDHTVVVQWFELRNRDCLHAFNRALKDASANVESSEKTEETGATKETNNSTITDLAMEVESDNTLQKESKSSGVVSSDAQIPEAVPTIDAPPGSGSETKDIAPTETLASASATLFHPKVLADNEDPNIRWYEQSQNFDAIAVDTVYCGVDLMEVLEFHPDVGLWKLPNALAVMKRVLQYDELEGAVDESGKRASPTSAPTDETLETAKANQQQELREMTTQTTQTDTMDSIGTNRENDTTKIPTNEEVTEAIHREGEHESTTQLVQETLETEGTTLFSSADANLGSIHTEPEGSIDITPETVEDKNTNPAPTDTELMIQQTNTEHESAEQGNANYTTIETGTVKQQQGEHTATETNLEHGLTQGLEAEGTNTTKLANELETVAAKESYESAPTEISNKTQPEVDTETVKPVDSATPTQHEPTPGLEAEGRKTEVQSENTEMSIETDDGVRP